MLSVWESSHESHPSVSAAYNFTQSGAGGYSIQPSNLFTYVDSDGTPNNLLANVEDAASVELSGNLAVTYGYTKRASFNNCSSTMQSQADAAAVSAQDYAGSAYSYISDISSGTTRYTTWFGAYDSIRKSTVQSHYQSISSHQYSSFTFDCTCTETDLYAYVCP